MAASGIPVAPRVLHDLQLARRACSVLGEAGEMVELWEAYSLAQIDAANLEKDLARGSATAAAALQKKLGVIRGDTGPLVEYLRQTLPVSVPLLADPKALDLALVF